MVASSPSLSPALAAAHLLPARGEQLLGLALGSACGVRVGWLTWEQASASPKHGVLEELREERQRYRDIQSTA